MYANIVSYIFSYRTAHKEMLRVLEPQVQRLRGRKKSLQLYSMRSTPILSEFRTPRHALQRKCSLHFSS